MRNMKKFLALVLAMLMVCSMAVMTTSAADEADYTDAAETLAALKIMKGNENGDLMLENGVTRYQTALFFVQALTGKTDAAVWNAEKKSVTFADVIDYGTAIDYAAGLGIVKGRGNGTFGYNDPIIYQDMIVMAVRALGYETADMSYPYGHILAAQKLGLLDDIDLVNYKAELKRGETAQLIENMLNTKIAVTDALTGKILYPDEVGLTDTLLGSTDRKTLLEQAGFASGKIEGYVESYVPADEEDEESFATVDVAGVTFKAADLGITDETAMVDFYGRYVEVLVDCKAEEYDHESEDNSVVVVNFADYTTVTNVGADTNIKFTTANGKNYLTLGAEKFELASDKARVSVYEFGADGWVPSATDLTDLFAYNNKDGYTDEDGNTYGAVEYLAYETSEVVVVTPDDPETEDVNELVTRLDEWTQVDVLYTEYTFGQYIERELPSQATGKDETFVVIGKYDANGYTTVDGEETDFVEYLLSGYTVNTNKVSKTKGEASMTVEVVGEAVQSGDFMFYAYNAVDNVLTVAKNCGTLETGRMTANNTTKETVKINGTNMEFGFDGIYGALVGFDATVDGTVDGPSLVQTIIAGLETGKDNVQYIAVDGKIVYMAEYVDGEEATAAGNFAIITTATDVVAKLLGITPTKYESKLTDGLYIEDGYVVVGMVNLTTGEWELAKVAAVAIGELVVEVEDNPETVDVDETVYGISNTLVEGEFTQEIDVATLAKYNNITSLSAANDKLYTTAAEVINSGVVAVVDEADGVYTIASVETVNDDADSTMFVDRFETTGGLTFNTVGRTNPIKATADDEVEAARISTNENTVIVVVAADGVQYRVGVQTAKKNVPGTATTFWAASESLIVLETDADIADNWGKGSATSEGVTYYVVLPGYGVEYGTTEEEDSYTLTIEGLYDLNALAMADAKVVTGTYDEVSDVADYIEANKVVVTDDESLAAYGDDIAAALAAIYADDDFLAGNITNFTDYETIALDINFDGEEGADVVVGDAQAAINATVVTFDFTGFDWADIDMDTMYVKDQAELEEVGEGEEAEMLPVEKPEWDTTIVEVEAEDESITYHYAYTLNLDDQVAEINEPDTGIVGDFELAMSGATIVAEDKVAEAPVEFTVTYSAVAAYDEDTQTVNVYIVKVVDLPAAPEAE